MLSKSSPSSARYIALACGFLLVITDFALSLFSPSKISIRAARIDSHSLEQELTTNAMSPMSQPSNHPPGHPVKNELKAPSSKLTAIDQALCLIDKKTNVPLGGDLKIQVIDRRSDEKSSGGQVYWIKSSLCPDEMYSIVSIDREGRIDSQVSCESTSLTELSLKSGLQGNIIDLNAEKTRDPTTRNTQRLTQLWGTPRPLAISGAGRFLVNCRDSGITLTRDGDFQESVEGLVNSEDCIAWTKAQGGRAVRILKGDVIDDYGCNPESGECLEIFDVDETDLNAFNFKNKNSLKVLDERGLREQSRPSIVIQNAIEDLDSIDRSLTGVANWEALPIQKKPAVCP